MDAVRKAREWCEERAALPLTQAYGGHYFAPIQTIWLDGLRGSIPEEEPVRTVALAALLHAASKCAASPGHTAQPLQPSQRAEPFIRQAWNKDIVALTRSSFASLSEQFALKRGQVQTADANEVALDIRQSDLVFIDPPYSGVHYSRFYHVLESIASGEPGPVSGVGRYPDRTLRPRSRYSVVGESRAALQDLLDKIAARHSRAIVTFPEGECSNGLSGDIVRDLAFEHFRVFERAVQSRFSTLGGTDKGAGTGRAARHPVRELILSLTSK